MTPTLVKQFESLSGWKTKAEYEHENDGYITFEEDPKTKKVEAFLWKADMSHEHLRTMWLCGHTFVKNES